jgi:membrane-associated phospholipid phosphatase
VATLPVSALIHVLLLKRIKQAANLGLDNHRTGCLYIVAVTINNLVAYTTAYFVGYLRPFFYSVCQPDAQFQSCSIEDTNSIRSSFPSASTSLSFCTCTLLSLYLERQFGLSSIQRFESAAQPTSKVMIAYPRQGRMGLHRFISFLALAPIAMAVFVGATLIVDNSHFPIDVVGGATLGMTVAFYCHQLW